MNYVMLRHTVKVEQLRCCEWN